MVVGPASVVDQVVAARASVVIQPSGIDVDQDVELVAVDSVGDAVTPVDVEPATAHVTIPVFSNRQSKTLPVNAASDGLAGGRVRDRVGDASTRRRRHRRGRCRPDGGADRASNRADPDRRLSPRRRCVASASRLPTGVIALDAQRSTSRSSPAA